MLKVSVAQGSAQTSNVSLCLTLSPGEVRSTGHLEGWKGLASLAGKSQQELLNMNTYCLGRGGTCREHQK